MENKEMKPNKASTHSYGIGILCFFIGLAGITLSIFALVRGNIGVLPVLLLIFGIGSGIVSLHYLFKVSAWLSLDEGGREEKKKGLDKERILLTAVALVVAFTAVFVI